MNKFCSLIYPLRTCKRHSKRMIKSIVVSSCLILSGYAYSSVSLNEDFESEENVVQSQVTGTVLDEKGVPLPGVNISIKGTVRGTQTDFDGNFKIEAAKGDVLSFSYIGFKQQEIKVGNFSNINVTMTEDLTGLDEVVIVGFSTKQSKEGLVGAITQVKPADLKIPSSNLTTSFAGRVPGVVSFQSSGEPGQGSDNAQFFIRGATTFGNYARPLILVDNIELTPDDLARISPDDIESFSVFKDATATAIYGARGANGVISVKTKSGELGKPRVSVRYETTYSQATQNLEIADPLTYMRLHMDAVNTRNASDNINIPLPYLSNKIDNTIAGTNPFVYPVTDWQDELLQDFTKNQRLNFSISGGGKVARYYVSGSVAQDSGILKVDERANYNNNIDNKVYNLRSNVNIDLTPTTELIVQLNQTVDDYRGPVPTGNQVYNMINRTNPVRYPAFYAPDEAHATREHLLFGNVDTGEGTLASYLNPYAELVRGYRDYSRNVSLLSLQVKQDLSGITEGLRWRALGNITNTSSYNIRRQYNPYYFAISDNDYNRATDTYALTPLNPDGGTEFLDYAPQPNDRVVNRNIYFETAFNYDRTFGEKHSVSGLLVGIARESVDGNADDLQSSLPSRNLGVSGRFTYDFDRRYFIEGNFGYNGSERFAEKNRFGFFPSVGAAWVISNEPFFKGMDFVSRLKLRGSYGVVGNANIGNRNDRFFYLSDINFNGTGATFGTFGGDSETGVSISRYENPYISWERSYKQNYGLEINLFKDAVQFQAEYFEQRTTDILQTRTDIPSFLGLQSTPVANLGEGKSGGFELTLTVNHSFNKDWWLQATANFVKTRSEFTIYEEPDYSETPWLSRIGNPFNQAYGLVAERLFVDDADVANSPEQQFGEVMPGDIKYTDINGDGIISTLDIVPIGEPTQAEISYGFGFSLGYKNFDISAFFAGLDNVSFFMNSEKLTPFADTDANGDYLSGAVAENQILQAFADSHWSEENQDIYALWPRLSSYAVQNNNQRSTWWMRDGAFMRLKSLELGYNFTPDNGAVFGQANVRLYLSGTNLVHWSKFKLWDPELRGNGLNYPLQRTVNIGARVNL